MISAAWILIFLVFSLLLQFSLFALNKENMKGGYGGHNEKLCYEQKQMITWLMLVYMLQYPKAHGSRDKAY